jgi:hypothetical protein
VFGSGLERERLTPLSIRDGAKKMGETVRLFRFVLVLGVLLMAPLAAFALEAPSYKFVEGGYFKIEDGSSSDSESGWFAGAMFGGKRWQAFVEYDDASDISLLFIGGGWHGLLGEKADVVAQISYLDASSSGGSDESGYRATGGVRWQLIKILELGGYFHYTDLDGGDEAFELEAVFTFGRIGVGASYETDDVDITKAFVRWNFGK